MSNQQLEQLVGLSKEQIVGKTDYDIFPQEIAEQFRASDRAVQLAGHCLEQEEVFRLNQRTYTFVTSKCPFYDATGAIYAVCGVSTNITARKRVEPERDRFFNLSLDMLVIGNYDGYITHLNPAWERILGFTLEELKVQPFIELIHPEDVAATQAEIEKLKAGIPVSSFENRYRCKDNSYKWLSWTVVPFLEEKLMYAVARDVSDVCNELCLRKQAEEVLLRANEELEIRVEERTAHLRQVNDELVAEIVERRQVEIALRKSESLYRTLVETIPHGILEIDTTGIIIFSNRANQRMLGYADEELLGKSILDLASESERSNLLEDMARQVQDQPPPSPYLGKFLTKDGNLIDVQGDWNYKRDEQGQVTGFISVVTDITQRKQAEQKIQFQARLLDAVQQSVVATDLAGNIIYWNRYAEQLYGWEASEVLGRSVVDVTPAATTKEQAVEIMSRLQMGESWSGEFWVQQRDGSAFPAMVFDSPIRDDEARLIGIIGISVDITQRKQAEEAQRKSEELYRTLASNFPNGVVSLFDKDLRYTLTEGKGLAEVGLSKEFLEGKTLAEIFSPEVCEIKERAYRAALDGNPTSCEIPFGDRCYWMHALPVRNERGEIYAGMSMSQDISDRKRAEQALLEERNFVSAILDIAAALIMVCDREGRFIRINRACEQITGYSLDEVKGKYFWDLFLIPEEVEPVKAIFQELQLGQFPKEHENYWVTRDGNRRLISWSNTVLLDADGLVKYIVSIGIDITERKRAQEIRRALEREQELSELRLRFFSMASHEFRTPLSTILVSTKILESCAQEWSEEKRLRNIRRINSAAKNMNHLLDDILTINRAETGKLEFNPTLIDIEQLCQQVVEEMRLFAGSQHILTFSYQSEYKKAFIDKKQLCFIMTNLLSNAIKYSPKGGEVHLALTSEQGEVTFQIRDPGIGIPLSDQPHLFEAFHRGENVGNIPGSGLGLTVVKKCVDLHCGRISVTSEVGVGTTFTVTIPFRGRRDYSSYL
jgi:PAS domain S-box-containing protein